MERPSWIPSLYGYAVCLIAVVTLLIGTANFVEAIFVRANPLQARDYAYGPGGASLISFEAYRATYPSELMTRPTRTGPPREAAPGDTLTTAELRARYEALRADRIGRASFEGTQRLVKHGLLILLAVVLFLTHWRWLRSRPVA